MLWPFLDLAISFSDILPMAKFLILHMNDSSVTMFLFLILFFSSLSMTCNLSMLCISHYNLVTLFFSSFLSLSSQLMLGHFLVLLLSWMQVRGLHTKTTQRTASCQTWGCLTLWHSHNLDKGKLRNTKRRVAACFKAMLPVKWILQN